MIDSPGLRSAAAAILDQAAAVTLVITSQSAFLLPVPFLYPAVD